MVSEDDIEDDEIDYSKFDSAKTGLEEIRRRFDLEERRSDVIETKTGTIFALDAIIVSTISVIDGISSVSKIIIFTLLFASAIQALRVLRTHDYQRPMESSRNVSRYVSLSNEEFEMKFIKMYIKSTENNARINNNRICMYRVSLFFTVSAVVVLAIISIISQTNMLLTSTSNNSTMSLYLFYHYLVL